MAKYNYSRRGCRIVAAFRRVLETGDVEKITMGLYQALTMHGGFIAHFNIDGFRDVYRGRLTELLAGEFYRLDDPELWPRMLHLKDTEYSDGMSARDVMCAIATIGAELAPVVTEREAKRRDEDEIAVARALASKHGMRLVSS